MEQFSENSYPAPEKKIEKTFSKEAIRNKYIIKEFNRIHPLALSVFLAIWACSDDTETIATVSLQELCLMVGRSITTVAQAVRALEEARIIKRSKQGQKPTVYFLKNV